MCDPIVIKNINRDTLARFKKELEAAGFKVTQLDWTHGEIQGKGVKLKYTGAFANNSQTTDITLFVLKKPFYVSCDKIRKEILKHTGV